MRKIAIILFILGQLSLGAQTKPTLYIGADIYTAANQVIVNGAMSVKEGRIEWVAPAANIKIDSAAFDKIVKLYGKRIYPGFIALSSTLGLTEIDAVRATLDYNETGTLNPNVRSQIAFNSESEVIKTVRSNGVLMAQSAPRGQMAGGFSSVFHFDGWNWEDATIKKDDALHIYWPYHRTRFHILPDDTTKYEKARTEKIKALYQLFNDAKAYCLQPESSREKNLKLESICQLMQGKQSIFVYAEDQWSIREAIQFIGHFQFKKPVLCGVDEVLPVLPIVKNAGVKLVLGRTHRLPAFNESAVDEPYRLPTLLAQEGIEFAITNLGDMEAMGTRNLSYNAGTMITYGLSAEKALQAITIIPAKLLGIDQDYGSIEVGKWASFIVSSGDVFDMRTSKIEAAYIQGKPIDINNKQKDLYKKFETKYGLQHQE